MKMGHKTKGHRARATAALVATLILSLALTSQALAGPPVHLRTPKLDVTGLNKACGTAVDSKGDLYAASAGESKIKVYDPTHKLLTEIADTHEPCALAVDNFGTLVVSDQGTGNVVLYAPDKYPLTGSPIYSSAKTIDASGEAKGISIDPLDNRLYVAEGDHVSVYAGEAQEL